MTTYHIIEVSHKPDTETKPAKVKMYSTRFGQTLFISYNNEPGASTKFGYAYETAIKHLQKNGFEIIGDAEGTDKHYLISTTFKKLIP